MKGMAQLEWLQLLQLNKCGWMIISFPPRNKRKRRQHWIITQSKTIKLDFEVVALPNLRNTSGVEMVFWAQPTGAVGPLCRGPRGRTFLFLYCRAAFGLLRTLVCVPTHRALQQTARVHSPFTAVQELSHDPIPASKPAECECGVVSPRAHT